VLSFGLAGCGPITTTTTLGDATIAIEAARGAQADRFAVYEFVSAESYFRKAREEQGLSDFQAAINFANKAEAFAIRAKARAQAKTGAVNAVDQTPAVTPTGPSSVTPNRKPSTDAMPSGSSL
jgi:hypothetical protein